VFYPIRRTSEDPQSLSPKKTGFAGAIPQRLDARPALVINIPPGGDLGMKAW
jgi:hypothetical protein